MKYAWIASNKANWPITLACEVLGVSTSGYFEHGRRKKFPKPSKPGAHKRMSNEALLAHIRAIHAEVKGEYGWPKMWKELVARGHRVGKERVRRLMQLHPKDPHAYNALGYSLADRNLRLAEAKQLITRALELAPEDPAITDSLGWVEFRLGNLPVALSLLKKAYANQSDAEIAAHMGEVLWQLNQREEAQKIWREGLQKGGDTETLRETLRRLKVDL